MIKINGRNIKNAIINPINSSFIDGSPCNVVTKILHPNNTIFNSFAE